ncbi:MAG: hypothetical protein [Circular genetic element sp.]|nr:MAG: hypothetical protein [Circular genetic element sp.]
MPHSFPPVYLSLGSSGSHNMADVTMTLEEYEALRRLITSERESEGATIAVAEKPKRKATAANRKYSKAFKKLAPKFKLKSGSWKKNGFANCCKAAHKMCKK